VGTAHSDRRQKMAKVILRGNQPSTIVWALELARATYDGMESEMEGWKDIDNLLASINKQLEKGE
jgi:hypothetical protein